jgi:hypothetical protein
MGHRCSAPPGSPPVTLDIDLELIDSDPTLEQERSSFARAPLDAQHAEAQYDRKRASNRPPLPRPRRPPLPRPRRPPLPRPPPRHAQRNEVC